MSTDNSSTTRKTDDVSSDESEPEQADVGIEAKYQYKENPNLTGWQTNVDRQLFCNENAVFKLSMSRDDGAYALEAGQDEWVSDQINHDQALLGPPQINRDKPGNIATCKAEVVGDRVDRRLQVFVETKEPKTTNSRRPFLMTITLRPVSRPYDGT